MASCGNGFALLLLLIGALQVMTSVIPEQLKYDPRDPVRMCYFTNWSQYRRAEAKFSVSNIDPFLCSHIVYAFAQVDTADNTLKTVDDNDLEMYAQIVALKKTNPRLKVLLSVGGASQGTAAFEAVAGSEARANVFAANTAAYLRKYGFDGFDLVWKFETESTKFALLVEKLRAKFMLENVASLKTTLLLTIAVSGKPENLQSLYALNRTYYYVDYLTLMTHDLWGTWETKLGHHSPLNVTIPGHPYSMTKAVSAWLKVVPQKKIVLGLAAYGRTGQLTSAAQHNLGDQWTRTPGPAGIYTKKPGFLAYYEICEKQILGEKTFHSEYNEAGDAPFGWDDKSLLFVNYDNVRSFTAKAQFVNKNRLGGVSVWALDLDDFGGYFCGTGKYPLLSAVKSVLSVDDALLNNDHGSNNLNATEALMGSNCPTFVCPTWNGYYPDPGNCTRYYHCSFTMPYLKFCSPPLKFDPYIGVCSRYRKGMCNVTC